MHWSCRRRIQDHKVKHWRDDVQQVSHSFAKKKFAWIRYLVAARNKAQILVRTALNNRKLIGFPAEIVSQAGGGRRPQGQMKARRSEVSVNQKNATVGLADNRLCEICSDKRLAFCGNTAGNNDALQQARISNLRQPRPESSKRLGPDFFAVGASEHAHARIQCPFRMRSEEHTSELQSRLHLVCRL